MKLTVNLPIRRVFKIGQLYELTASPSYLRGDTPSNPRAKASQNQQQSKSKTGQKQIKRTLKCGNFRGVFPSTFHIATQKKAFDLPPKGD